MLTPVDIHYLVGLLTLVSQPDSVDVDLGARVRDRAAQKDRDVDVLITYKDSTGESSALTGIEVKKHSRPLTVEHVEQLMAKLADMPSLCKRGIVSASGYTRGAVSKAQTHGTELFLFSDWQRGVTDYAHVDASCQFKFVHRVLTWIDTPQILYRPDKHPPGIAQFLHTNPKVIFEGNAAIVMKLSDLNSSLPTRALNTLIHDKKFYIPDDSIHVRVNLTFAPTPIVESSEGRFILNGADVQGVVRWQEMQVNTQYKSLYRFGENKPYVTCAITETTQGLYGLTFSQNDRSINLVRVSVSDRNKKKIFKRPIRRNC